MNLNCLGWHRGVPLRAIPTWPPSLERVSYLLRRILAVARKHRQPLIPHPTKEACLLIKPKDRLLFTAREGEYKIPIQSSLCIFFQNIGMISHPNFTKGAASGTKQITEPPESEMYKSIKTAILSSFSEPTKYTPYKNSHLWKNDCAFCRLHNYSHICIIFQNNPRRRSP